MGMASKYLPIRGSEESAELQGRTWDMIGAEFYHSSSQMICDILLNDLATHLWTNGNTSSNRLLHSLPLNDLGGGGRQCNH